MSSNKFEDMATFWVGNFCPKMRPCSYIKIGTHGRVSFGNGTFGSSGEGKAPSPHPPFPFGIPFTRGSSAEGWDPLVKSKTVGRGREKSASVQEFLPTAVKYNYLFASISKVFLFLIRDMEKEGFEPSKDNQSLRA